MLARFARLGARATARRHGVVAGSSAAVMFVALAAGCGESRQPIGEDCLRGDDCLSGICSDRVCVSAPTLLTGVEPSPPDDSPSIPDEGAQTDAGARDAAGGGG